ncbi:MAG TPA: hypothetical protein VJT73_09760, partial [Polyangiaceae bacterium]|nr:hypothetical protein [Polyangiaceae bacterium]
MIALRDIERALRRDGPFWRGLASFGAAHAPEPVLRYAPPVWALAFTLALPDIRARVTSNLRAVVGQRPRLEEMADVVRTVSHFASCFTEALAIGGEKPPEVDFVAL